MTDARPATDAPNTVPDASVPPGDGGAQSSPSVGGCGIFPADDPWNQVIPANAAIDATWTQKLIGNATKTVLHPDFGTTFGIPYNVVPANQATLPITFDYNGDSDPGPYPFPGPGAKVEGGTPTACTGDCHVLTLVQTTCALYEGWNCHYNAGGNSWHCGSGAKFDLTKVGVGQRPKGWTSADAAGLAILPGLARYDEVAAGAIKHAIRFTMHCTQDGFVTPASHQAVPTGNSGCPAGIDSPRFARSIHPWDCASGSRQAMRSTVLRRRPRSSRKPCRPTDDPRRQWQRLLLPGRSEPRLERHAAQRAEGDPRRSVRGHRARDHRTLKNERSEKGIFGRMFFAFFRLQRAQWLILALPAIATTGCTLDFDRFTPVPSSSPADAGVTPELEAASAEDVSTPSIDSSSGVDSADRVDSGMVADANPSGPGDAVADARSCTEARSVTFGGHCYFAVTSRSNWMAASTTCQAAGAHLATFGSVEEQTAVAAINANQDRWIGLSRPVASLPMASSYAWVTSEPAVYANWGVGEPNFTGECVRMMQGARGPTTPARHLTMHSARESSGADLRPTTPEIPPLLS